MADEMDLNEGRKSGLMKIVIILVVVLVVLGGAAAALRVFAPGLIPGWGEKPEQPAVPADGGTAESGGQKLGIIIGLKPFIVNLRDPLGKRYLKLELSLEVPNEEVKTEVDGKLPPIRNDILLLLSNMSYEDIADSEGKRRLRRQIKDRCDAYLSAGKVTDVYFSEFVVQ